MVAPAYDTLTTDDTGADKILTTSTVQALDTNPVAIAQRGANAPIVQVPVREWKTSGTGATFNIPATVSAMNIYVGGGCGGNGGTPAASTVTYNGVTYTGNPGSNGGTSGDADGGKGGDGGTATGGDRNITGQRGSNGAPGGIGGGTGEGGGGGMRAIWGGNGATGTDGSFGNGGRGGGGAGGMCVVRVAIDPSVLTATYTVGAGGTNADGGLVVFEY